MRTSLLLTLLLAVALVAVASDAAAQSFTLQERLVSRGGEAVSVCGRFMAVGDIDYGSSGVVHVYRNSLAGWVYETELSVADLADGERFGYAVAVDSKTVAVAAGSDGPPLVYIFRRTTGRNSRGPYGPQGPNGAPNEQGWAMIARLEIPAPAGTAVSLDISGRALLIGIAARSERVAHVYRYRKQVWTYEGELRPVDDPVGFGAHIALANSSRAIVGARDEAVVYHRNGSRTGWQEVARLSYRGHGDVVAAEDATVAVSAYPEEGVRVFRLIDDLWTTVATLQGSDARDGDGFGKAVGYSDGYLIVGAPDQGRSHGAAYLFAETPAGWVEQAKLTASTPGYYFGNEVSIHQGTLVVGSWGSGAWCFE